MTEPVGKERQAWCFINVGFTIRFLHVHASDHLFNIMSAGLWNHFFFINHLLCHKSLFRGHTQAMNSFVFQNYPVFFLSIPCSLNSNFKQPKKKSGSAVEEINKWSQEIISLKILSVHQWPHCLETHLWPLSGEGSTALEIMGFGSLTLPPEIQFPCFSLGVTAMRLSMEILLKILTIKGTPVAIFVCI